MQRSVAQRQHFREYRNNDRFATIVARDLIGMANRLTESGGIRHIPESATSFGARTDQGLVLAPINQNAGNRSTRIQVGSGSRVCDKTVMSASVSITVQIPRELRDLCGGCATLALSAASVREALDEIERRHPSIHRNICDETGRLRPHINLFVNSSLIREREGVRTTLESGDVVSILPAVSGG